MHACVQCLVLVGCINHHILKVHDCQACVTCCQFVNLTSDQMSPSSMMVGLGQTMPNSGTVRGQHTVGAALLLM